MATLIDKGLEGAIGAIVALPFGFTLGYLSGYAYGKFSGLSAGEAGKAYAVWLAASAAIATFVLYLTDESVHRQSILVGINILLRTLGIYQLRRMELMGNKMMIACIAFSILELAVTLKIFSIGKDVDILGSN